MAETRVQLTPVQLEALAKLEKEIATLTQEMERLKEKQGLVSELILDAHGLLGKKVRFDGPSKSLVVTEE